MAVRFSLLAPRRTCLQGGRSQFYIFVLVLAPALFLPPFIRVSKERVGARVGSCFAALHFFERIILIQSFSQTKRFVILVLLANVPDSGIACIILFVDMLPSLHEHWLTVIAKTLLVPFIGITFKECTVALISVLGLVCRVELEFIVGNCLFEAKTFATLCLVPKSGEPNVAKAKLSGEV